MLHRPQLASATKSGEYFVSNHKPIVSRADLTDPSQERRRWNPVATFSQPRLNEDSSDVVLFSDAAWNMVIQEPKAVIDILFFAHVSRNLITVWIRRANDATDPAFEVGSIRARKATQHFRAEAHAMKR